LRVLKPEVGDTPMTTHSKVASLIAILAACTAFAVGMGLTLPLLSLVLERRGFAGSINGLNLATAGFAAMVITPNVPRLISKMGTSAYLSVSLALSALALLALFEIQNLWLWFPTRFLLSLGLSGLFVTSEFWINQLADESNRGRLIAYYGIATAGGFGLGPAVLWFLGTHGIAPFAFGATLLVIAILPVQLARRTAPLPRPDDHGSIMDTLRDAPGIVAAAFMFGIIDSGLIGLLPVYAVRSGYTDPQAAIAITAVSLGGIVFQYPLGWLSDHMDRRRLLVLCAVSGAIGASMVPFAVHVPWLLYGILFLWGGPMLGIYTIGLTLLGQRFKGPRLASANAAYVLLYAAGLFSGPLAEGVALDAWNPHGLMVVLGAASLIYVGFLILGGRQAA